MNLFDRCIRITTVVLIGILCFTLFTIAEEITLTNYYPAPGGTYDELEVEDLDVTDLHVQRLAVGTIASLPAADGDANIAGDIDVDTRLIASSYRTDGETGITGSFSVNAGSSTLEITNGIVTGLN